MWVAVVLFAIVLCILTYLDTRKPKNFPPGPKWLPILGSLLDVARRRKTTKYLSKICTEIGDEYNAPMIGLRLGQDLLVIVNRAKLLKEFLASDDLAGRPYGHFHRVRTWGERFGLLLTDSDFWKEQRRFCLRHLREFGFGRRTMSAMIEEETANMVKNIKDLIKKSGGDSVDCNMEKLFGIHVLNTLWTMLAGVRYDTDDAELKRLQSLLSELFERAHMVGALFNHFPFLRFVAPEYSGYNVYVRAHIPLWDFLSKEIKHHKDTFNPSEMRDFIDVYLEMLNTSGKPHSFSEKQLLAICLDLFVAGSETTSKTLAFGFLYLLLYPDVQRKAREEIDRVVGRKRAPTLEDRLNMPYVEATTLESLRMFMGRGFAVPHRAVKDTTLGGYFIPKDTTVLANFHEVFMGQDFPDCDPDVFRPERYLSHDEKSISLPDNYMPPFGFGKHRCMGETLARANVFLFIATLLQNFEFISSVDAPPSLEWKDGITPNPFPYKATIVLRR